MTRSIRRAATDGANMGRRAVTRRIVGAVSRARWVYLMILCHRSRRLASCVPPARVMAKSDGSDSDAGA
jgi:hypothetical protein